jgi:hypothetical protein
VPRYEFTGGDPIDHFHLGHVEPGDVVEAEQSPGAAWKAARRRTRTEQPSSDVPEEV